MIKEQVDPADLASEPLVSIVLPTFNRAELLPYAIRSILAQTYHNFELIIVDDHSSDNTQSIVAQFNDSRIRYLRNDVNQKLPRSLNSGFAASKGQYLTWTSDDNLYAKNAIEKMVNYAQQHHGEFVFADYFHFSDLEKGSGTPLDAQHIKLPDTLQLDRCNQVGACFLYSRNVYETVGEYDPELFLVEDYDYFIRVSQSFEMHHLDEPLYYFRRHENSLYCSRYFEVKASDLLVRYKNRLLEKEELNHAASKLMLANLEMLRHGFVRQSFSAITKLSYSLAQLYKKIIDYYLSSALSSRVDTILGKYDNEAISFREAKDDLVTLLQEYIDLEYQR